MSSRRSQIFTALSLALTGLFFTPTCEAGTLFDSLTPVGGVTWDSLPTHSWDSAAANAFYSDLSSYVDQQAYSLSSTFSGGPNGSTLDVLLFTEVSGYSNLNTVSLCTTSSCDLVFTGADSAGVLQSRVLNSDDELFFSLISPAGAFSSLASANADGLDHFVFFRVTQSGSVSLNGGAFMLNLLAGDLLFGVEDLFGPLGATDRDFNDMFFQARITANAVPEPASLSLLALGGLAAVHRRRRQRSN